MRGILLALLWPLLVLACAYTLLRYWWAVVQNPRKALDIAEAIDVAANVSLNGQPETTISGRAGRARMRGRTWGCLLCWLLDRIDSGHCDRSVYDEAQR